MGQAEGCSERQFCLAEGEDVNMIRHDAVSQDPQFAVGGVFGEQIQVDPAQAIVKEDARPGMASLGDVMRPSDP